MSSWMSASRAAMIISKSSIELSHILILAEIVSSNRVTFWSMTATEPIKTFLSISSMGCPSNVMLPLHGLYSPLRSLASVDLPQPERPTRAIFCPGFMESEKSVISGSPSGA